MSHFAGTAFGIGTPTLYPVGQLLQQPYAFAPTAFTGTGYGIGSYGAAVAAPQQISQLLQIVPQQLQQVQILQQQQLVLLQQLLQLLPAQLQQLQQLIQFAPSLLQQLQQHQPFGAALSSPVGYGLAPQSTGHVM
jgi:hypothetical protein